jgi:hypothetical protein
MDQHRTFSVEHLEPRQMLYAATLLPGGVLSITADSYGDSVEVSQQTSWLTVASRRAGGSPTTYFPAMQVNEIVFQGSQYDDLFINNTYKTSQAHGLGGSDVLWGGFAADSLYGDDGNDFLGSRAGVDALFGGLGNDILDSGGDSDLLVGDAGNDTIKGGAGNDIVFGGAGNDWIFGGDDNDLIFGGEGNDTIEGNSGADSIAGEGGNDSILGGVGQDIIYGGYAQELAVEAMKRAPSARLQALPSLLWGALPILEDGNDILSGGSEDDWLYGGRGINVVSGDSGNDAILSYGAAQDHVYGGSGCDRLLAHGWTAVTAHDFNDNDVRLNFKDGKGESFGYANARWQVADIRKVDQVLAALQRLSGGTTLLEKSDGRVITFVRQGRLLDADKAYGMVAWNSAGTITLTNQNFEQGTGWLTDTVLHEIGHNWDNENRDWRAFQAISGWTSSDPHSTLYRHSIDADENWWYLASRDRSFAWSYGKTSPYEDFATCFASYFMRRVGYTADTDDDAVLAEKMQFMGRFVRSLRVPTGLGMLIVA